MLYLLSVGQKRKILNETCAFITIFVRYILANVVGVEMLRFRKTNKILVNSEVTACKL